MKLRGEQSAAVMSARLKLRVLNVLKVAPRRSREKDWVRSVCWIGSRASD